MAPWSRSFAVRAGAIALAGLGLRIAFALHYGPHLGVGGDGYAFHNAANTLAEGHGYVYAGYTLPSAEHPPLYSTLLALVSLLGGKGLEAHRVASCVMGAGTVLACGYLGRRAGGERVGLLAAVLAAVYPVLVLTDETLYSESLYGLTIALALIAAYRYLDRPSAQRAAILGAAIGLAALTRAEALLLVGLLAAPVAIRARESPLRHWGLAALATVVVIAPWTIRSTLALDTPVVISTNYATLVAGANCPITYHSGDLLGLWSAKCYLPTSRFAREADRIKYLRRRGTRYASDHPGRLALVALVRVARVWDLYRPGQNADYEAFFEGRQPQWARRGVWFYYALVVLGAWGALVLRRRRQTLVVLGAPFLLVTVTAALAYGVPRFRMPADVALVVLAAAGIDALARRVGGRGRVSPAPSATPTR